MQGIKWGCWEIDSPKQGQMRLIRVTSVPEIFPKKEKRWLRITIFSPLHVIM